MDRRRSACSGDRPIRAQPGQRRGEPPPPVGSSSVSLSSAPRSANRTFGKPSRANDLRARGDQPSRSVAGARRSRGGAHPRKSSSGGGGRPCGRRGNRSRSLPRRRALATGRGGGGERTSARVFLRTRCSSTPSGPRSRSSRASGTRDRASNRTRRRSAPNLGRSRNSPDETLDVGGPCSQFSPLSDLDPRAHDSVRSQRGSCALNVVRALSTWSQRQGGGQGRARLISAVAPGAWEVRRREASAGRAGEMHGSRALRGECRRISTACPRINLAGEPGAT